MPCNHKLSKAHEETVCRTCGASLNSFEGIAQSLMRTCYDEANRLANHGSSGLEKLVMSQLYEEANAAKGKLSEMSSPSGIEAAVCDDIAERQKKGIAKYGLTVAENPLNLREWLQHAYEETLDKAVYLKRAIAMLAEPCGEMGGNKLDCPHWQNGLCICEPNSELTDNG